MPASRNKKKRWNDVSFFTFMTPGEKKNDSDYKHTLFTKSSNSGSLRWCESSVWSPSLGNFSNPSSYKKPPQKHWCRGRGEKEEAFAVVWLQIITTQWTNICLVNSSITKRVLATVEPFEILSRATFLCQALTFSPQTARQMWEKLLRGHPGARRVWSTHIF